LRRRGGHTNARVPLWGKRRWGRSDQAIGTTDANEGEKEELTALTPVADSVTVIGYGRKDPRTGEKFQCVVPTKGEQLIAKGVFGRTSPKGMVSHRHNLCCEMGGGEEGRI